MLYYYTYYIIGATTTIVHTRCINDMVVIQLFLKLTLMNKAESKCVKQSSLDTGLFVTLELWEVLASQTFLKISVISGVRTETFLT